MKWDVTYDGSDYESCDSNSDFLVEENNVVSLMVRLAEYGETVVPKDLVRRKGDVSGVLNETITVTEKRLKNIKKGLLESSQNKGNVTEGIWKCEKVPSENLPEMRAIFFIKKCPKKHKNNAAGFVGKKCLMRRNVLKDITEKVIQGNYIIKCSKCDRRLCDVLNVFKGINYESINKKNLSCSCPHKKLSSHSPRKNSIPLESIAKEFFMEIGNGTYKNGDELNVGTISEKLKFKKRRLYDVMEVLAGLGWIEHKGKDCPYIIKDKTKFKALCNNSLEVGEPLKEKQK